MLRYKQVPAKVGINRFLMKNEHHNPETAISPNAVAVKIREVLAGATG